MYDVIITLRSGKVRQLTNQCQHDIWNELVRLDMKLNEMTIVWKDEEEKE